MLHFAATSSGVRIDLKFSSVTAHEQLADSIEQIGRRSGSWGVPTEGGWCVAAVMTLAL
jgi:hypothetical protein